MVKILLCSLLVLMNIAQASITLAVQYLPYSDFFTPLQYVITGTVSEVHDDLGYFRLDDLMVFYKPHITYSPELIPKQVNNTVRVGALLKVSGYLDYHSEFVALHLEMYDSIPNKNEVTLIGQVTFIEPNHSHLILSNEFMLTHAALVDMAFKLESIVEGSLLAVRMDKKSKVLLDIEPYSSSQNHDSSIRLMARNASSEQAVLQILDKLTDAFDIPLRIQVKVIDDVAMYQQYRLEFTDGVQVWNGQWVDIQCSKKSFDAVLSDCRFRY